MPLSMARPSHPAVFLSQMTAGITSLFGELVYIASLWDDSRGRYHEARLTATFSPEETMAVLRRRHHTVFAEWLLLPLEQQAAELMHYLDEAGKNRAQTLRSWMQDRWYERLVPKDAATSERLLFGSDLEILLPMIYRDITGAAYE